MRIGLIGGIDRSEPQLVRLAAAAGHDLEVHHGDTGGRGSVALAALVERADLVVILTDVNSHNGVLLAKKLCRRFGRSSLLVRNCGPSRFQRLLSALAAGEPCEQRAAS